ncbi:MAG: lysophospholipid acyltransferase family protein [Candidatus Babeliales bacterium]
MRGVVVVKTLFLYFFLAVLCFLYSVPFIMYFFVPKSVRFESCFYYYLIYSFYWSIIFLLKWVLPLPLFVEGEEHIPQKPTVFVCNHQSALDIPLLGVLLNGAPHIWLAKKALMQSWFLRLILPEIAILVDNTTAVSSMRSLVHALRVSKYGKHHLCIFPEGGRYINGKVHSFYGGFAILAKKTGMPVVPIRIFDVQKVYSPGSFYIYSYPVKMVVGEPVYIGSDELEEHFKERVYQWFIKQEEHRL